MDVLEYSKPPENKNMGKDYVHSFDIFGENGEKIGKAEFTYHSNPLPFYYIESVGVGGSFRDKGYGSFLVQHINNFLNEKGKAGLLVSTIQDPRKQDLYEKNGWTRVEGNPDWHVYNLPPGTDQGRILKMIHTVDKTELLYKRDEQREKPQAA